MRKTVVALFSAAAFTGATWVSAQNLPAPEGSRQSMLREAGVLTAQAVVPETRVQRECLELPVNPPNDRSAGLHGEALVSARCEVIAYKALTDAPPRRVELCPLPLDVAFHRRGRGARPSRAGYSHRRGSRPFGSISKRRGAAGLA